MKKALIRPLILIAGLFLFALGCEPDDNGEPDKPSQYTISLSANPVEGGTVRGEGKFDEGTEITVTANANEGYSFQEWSEEGKEVSKSSSYTFTVLGERKLMANFKEKADDEEPVEPVGIYIDIEEVPLELHRRAAQLIEEMRGTEMAPGWEEAFLKEHVAVMFRPDIEGVAYYEFLVDPEGYIIVSTGDHDFPVTNWAFGHDSNSVRLQRLAEAVKQQVARLYKLDDQYFVAENKQGELVASLGSELLQLVGMDPDWLEKPPEEGWIHVEPKQPELDDNSADKLGEGGSWVEEEDQPEGLLELTSWKSWNDLKSGYAESYAVLIEIRSLEAEEDNQVERYAIEDGEGLLPGEEHILAFLYQDPKYTITGDGAEFVTAELLSGRLPSLKMVVGDPGADDLYFNVEISYPNGITETVRFFIAPREETRGFLFSGSSWSRWYRWFAGWSMDQRFYNQFNIYSGRLVGCGPVAWAMLFGWGDFRAWQNDPVWQPRWGLYRVDGGYGADAMAPKDNDDGIENVMREIRDHVKSFAVALSNQSATEPRDMKHARNYFLDVPLQLLMPLGTLCPQSAYVIEIEMPSAIEEDLPS